MNIDDNLNDALLDSPIYQNMLSVEPALNRSSLNETAAANITSVKKFSCLFDQLDYEMLPLSAFQMVNTTTLLSSLKQNPNITSRNQPAICQLVLFYAPWCPFSIEAAPHLNALPRGFPMLSFYAIDAYMHNSFSTIQGVMAIPSFFLFHNGKAAAKYNETEYSIELFVEFITRYTGITPVGVLNHTTEDYQGPIPTSITEVTDTWLILAWIVFFLSVLYWFTRSNLFWTLMENIRNTWREAEAQHHHVD